MIVTPEKAKRDLEKRTGREDRKSKAGTKRSNVVGKEEREREREGEEKRSIFVHSISTN